MLEDKIGDIIPSPKRQGSIGIEIEIEAENMLPPGPNSFLNHWVRTMDGSLRGDDNAEYVLEEPLDKEDALNAVDELQKAIQQHDSQIKDSVRAGVHIHLNLQNATFKQMWTFAVCYYVLEEALIARFCGEGRSGNHFCLRAIDADAVPYMVAQTIKSHDLHYLANDNVRYAALNFNSLFRHGSLEFRALRTPTDLEKVKTWIEVLLSIKEGSNLFNNPREVIEQFSMGGEFNFVRQMLKDNLNVLGEYDDELMMSLRRGVRIAQEIGYAIKEW